MRRYGNLFEKIISDENLKIALHNACLSNGRTSPAKRRAIESVRSDPDKWVGFVKERLMDYHTSNYSCFPLFDPKLRFIYSLPFTPDRIVHHALLNVLSPIWDSMFENFSCACRVGKGQHLAGEMCKKYVKKYKYCAQFDISQFYISINHQVLKQIIRKKIKDIKVLNILDEIIDSISTRDTNLTKLYQMKSKGIVHKDIDREIQKLETSKQRDNNQPAGVPVGSYTSQWFGNLIMNENDQYLKHVLKAKAIVRYCDDFVVFSNDKQFLQNVKKLEKDFLWNKLHLILSKAEIFPTDQGVDFCGYRYFPQGYVLLKKRTAKDQQRNLKQLVKDLNESIIDIETARNQLASMEGWLKWANCYNWKKHNNFIEIKTDIVNRFSDFNRDNHSAVKASIKDLIDKEIIVRSFEIKDSTQRIGSKCAHIQVEHDNQMRLVFTGSEVIMNQLNQNKDKLPFIATIKHINNYYTFA